MFHLSFYQTVGVLGRSTETHIFLNYAHNLARFLKCDQPFKFMVSIVDSCKFIFAL